MSFCESWNFLIIVRQAVLRPGSVQNQVSSLISFLVPCKKAGAERRVAALAIGVPASSVPAVAAAPIFMNSRRLILFLVWFGLLLSSADIVNSLSKKTVLHAGYFQHK